MSEKYIIDQQGYAPVVEQGKRVGFQFRLRIPYYLGVPFSQIAHIRAKLDGEDLPQEQLRVVASTGEVFRMEELVTVSSYFWEYGEKLRIQPLLGEPLPAGRHRLDVDVSIDVIYGNKNFGSLCWDEFELEPAGKECG